MSNKSTRHNDPIPYFETEPGAISNFELDFLRKRLEPITNAHYQDDRGCMNGTRAQIINDAFLWATRSLSQNAPLENSNADGMLWIYGMPGIGKSAIAHSICHRFNDNKQLGGSFFCRRDDPALSDARSVLPTLIYELAGIFGPYRNRVAQALRDDPQLTPQSVGEEMFPTPLQSLEAYPPQALVLVIDALDECGGPATRRQLLGHLFKACQRNQWLKSIIVSRPEHDIRSFFSEHGIVGRDLDQDDDSRADIEHFTRVRMNMVAEELHVSQDPEPWVGERRLSHIVNRSGGLFIFVETLSQYLMRYRNPKSPLNRLLAGPPEEASIELHKLYIAAIESRVNSEEAESRLISRAVIGVAPHRALCDEAIAALTGLEVSIVSSWVDDLSSLLYRDKTMRGGIRVRHISILEYFTGPFCPLEFRVDIKQAGVELSIYTLQTMMTELRFNICGMETSYLCNSDIGDLSERVQENISNILQYSCLHWFSHLCANHDPTNQDVCELLGAFLKGEHFLYWLEALSVMGKVPAAIVALRKIIACNRKFDEQIVNLAKDALRFVLAFFAPISTSAPHIYLSALPFTPSESSLWNNARRSFPKLMRVSEGRMTNWPRIGGTWKGHTGNITGVAYSPDGLNVISGSWDKTIRIWDAATGAPVGEPLVGHNKAIASVAYSRDGQSIISGSSDNTVRIWDAATGTVIGEPLIGHTDGVTSVAYSPDSSYIISGSWDNTIRIWDASTGASIGEPLKGHTASVHSVIYSPDGRSIVSGSYDNTIRIWDATTGIPVGEPLTGHTDEVASIVYSPDSQNIASGSHDKTIRIWDAATGAPVGEPLKGHTNWVLNIVYSPNGQTIASSSTDKTIRIWNVARGVLLGEPLKGHTGWIASIVYSPDGRNILSGSWDKTIRVWDAATGVPVGETIMGHTDWITSLAYSPNGHNIATGSMDDTIRIWDAVTGSPISVLRGHTHFITSVAYSPDSLRIVSSSNDWTIRIWDAATGQPVGNPLKGHIGGVNSVAYSPNGQNIASGSNDMTVRIWDADTRASIGKPLKGHTGGVNSVAYSPDGRNIVSGSHDKTIRIWDVITGESVGVPLKGHTNEITSAVYSPDCQNIVSGSYDHTVRIWDALTGTPVGEPLKGHNGSVTSVTYSPDGQSIVSGSFDHTIRIWDAATGASVGDPLEGHTYCVSSIVYSPDCRNILSASYDQTIRVWDSQGAPKNDKVSSSTHLGLPSPILDKVLLNPSDLNAVHGIGFHSKSIDSDGWVRCDEGILFWVPEDCRHGLTSRAIKIVPSEAWRRRVRLDLNGFKYGKSWTDIYRST